jgi:hypothetical protein
MVERKITPNGSEDARFTEVFKGAFLAIGASLDGVSLDNLENIEFVHKTAISNPEVVSALDKFSELKDSEELTPEDKINLRAFYLLDILTGMKPSTIVGAYRLIRDSEKLNKSARPLTNKNI